MHRLQASALLTTLLMVGYEAPEKLSSATTVPSGPVVSMTYSCRPLEFVKSACLPGVELVVLRGDAPDNWMQQSDVAELLKLVDSQVPSAHFSSEYSYPPTTRCTVGELSRFLLIGFAMQEFAEGTSSTSLPSPEETRRIIADVQAGRIRYFDAGRGKAEDLLNLAKVQDVHTVVVKRASRSIVTRAEAEALLDICDDRTPSAWIISGRYSSVPGGRSTQGIVAKYIICGYLSGYFPTEPTSASRLPTTGELHRKLRDRRGSGERPNTPATTRPATQPL